jgi:hypothetical protein
MRTILFMRAVVMGIAGVTRNKIATQAKRMSNETNWQAFCDLSRIRISFTFIFFAIFTECLESNAGNRSDVREFLGFIELPTGIAME